MKSYDLIGNYNACLMESTDPQNSNLEYLDHHKLNFLLIGCVT